MMNRLTRYAPDEQSNNPQVERTVIDNGADHPSALSCVALAKQDRWTDTRQNPSAGHLYYHPLRRGRNALTAIGLNARPS